MAVRLVHKPRHAITITITITVGPAPPLLQPPQQQ
jgi:hypothetical protein